MTRHEVTTRRVLYEIPGMRSVRVSQGEFTGADGQPLPMTCYLPSAPLADPPPVVVVVEGYPDTGFQKFFGCRFMEMEWSVSLAQLMAASGLAVIGYSNRAPATDAVAVLAHLRANAASLGIDARRIGLWASSGNAPVALSILDRAGCAVLSNPLTFDHGGATHVAEAANAFGFVAPPMTALPEAKPIFVVRSGKDEIPGLNAALDRFAALALEANHPMTLVNHPDAPHSFDLYHDSATTRHILQQALDFLRLYLTGAP